MWFKLAKLVDTEKAMWFKIAKLVDKESEPTSYP